MYVKFWVVFYFWLHFSALFLVYELQIERKTISVYFFQWCSLRFREITYVKNVGETKSFFCFSLNKRMAKKAARKLDVFLYTLFLENEEKTSGRKKKEIFPINLLLTCQKLGKSEVK